MGVLFLLVVALALLVALPLGWYLEVHQGAALDAAARVLETQ